MSEATVIIGLTGFMFLMPHLFYWTRYMRWKVFDGSKPDPLWTGVKR